MSGGDPPIIVQGGSVTVDFQHGHTQFQDDGTGRHHNPDKRLQRIEITGDGLNINETFNTGNVTIKIYYGNP
jgi:hypothetical protein